MIQKAIVHIQGDQPLLADLLALPQPGDASLVCTNLRSLDGRKPVFIEHSASTFVFPYQHIRFVEILAEDESAARPSATSSGAAQPAPDAGDADLEIDEDFLRRIREA